MQPGGDRAFHPSLADWLISGIPAGHNECPPICVFEINDFFDLAT